MKILKKYKIKIDYDDGRFASVWVQAENKKKAILYAERMMGKDGIPPLPSNGAYFNIIETQNIQL